jgi:SAM-dependent methyltransferase
VRRRRLLFNATLMTRLQGLMMRVRARVQTPDLSDHVGLNRSQWDGYAARWSSAGFRRALASRGVEVDNLAVLGEEWTMTDLDMLGIIEEWISPHVTRGSVAAEIGVGGGRVAKLVADQVGELICFDVSEMMLEHAKRALAGQRNVSFGHVQEPRLPDDLGGRLDFIYSYDVFVHLDLHTIWKYVQEIARVLKPGGRAFLHTSNLTAPGGWKRFATQDHYSLDGHYFVTPEVVKTLVSHTDLRVVTESTPQPGAGVLNRDYLILLERPA